MWKKAFITLLSLIVLVFGGGAIWFVSLPSANSQTVPAKIAAGEKTATVQLSVGDDAINTYLEYALSEQADLKGVLSYATVHFNKQWQVQLGAKLAEHVIPLNVTFTPHVAKGNLQLHIDSASFGLFPLPTSGVLLVLGKVPWPNWIHVDDKSQTLDINLTERPQHPYGVKVLGYSSQTKLLTLLISIVPKSAFPHSNSSGSGTSTAS